MSNGRLESDEVGKPVIEDNPTKMVQALLTKQDEILAKLNEILDSIDTATDASELYTELAALDLTALKAIEIYK